MAEFDCFPGALLPIKGYDKPAAKRSVPPTATAAACGTPSATAPKAAGRREKSQKGKTGKLRKKKRLSRRQRNIRMKREEGTQQMEQNVRPHVQWAAQHSLLMNNFI